MQNVSAAVANQAIGVSQRRNSAGKVTDKEWTRYRPKLNPVERFCDVVKGHICNQDWEDPEALIAAINGVLAEHRTTPAKVRAVVGEGWLLVAANASHPSVLAA